MAIKLEEAPEWVQLSVVALVGVLLDRRRRGLVKEYRELKAEIDRLIKKFKLDADEVYFVWGDPEDPAQRDAVEEKISNFMMGLTIV